MLAAGSGGLVAARRPGWRIKALVTLGAGFLVLVVGWWTPLFVALIAIAHLAAETGYGSAGAASTRAVRLNRTTVAIVVFTLVLVGFKARALVDGGLLGTPLFVPVGLSYLVFQLIAYVVDVRRGRTAPAEDIATLAAFCLLPPIRMAGPVLRFGDFTRSLRRNHRLTRSRVLAGLAMIAVGLLKKRLLGDAVLDELDSWPVADLDRLAKAVTQLCALYFDASGFADIAEGCGMLLGIKIPASFSRPLTKGRSLGDFWRRWQMTVMGWFRDYVYAPIRGDGRHPQRARLALAFSFVASAAWHGLHPVWFAWGALTVIALMADQRVARFGASDRAPVVAAVTRSGRRLAMYVYMFALTTLLLAADRETLDSVRELFSGPLRADGLGGRLGLMLLVVVALILTDAWRTRRKTLSAGVNGALVAAGAICLAWPGEVDPFVYQRF